jgi:hypothetical protein
LSTLLLCEKVDYSVNMLLHLLAKSLAGKHAGETQISKLLIRELTVVIIRLSNRWMPILCTPAPVRRLVGGSRGWAAGARVLGSWHPATVQTPAAPRWLFAVARSEQSSLPSFCLFVIDQLPPRELIHGRPSVSCDAPDRRRRVVTLVVLGPQLDVMLVTEQCSVAIDCVVLLEPGCSLLLVFKFGSTNPMLILPFTSLSASGEHIKSTYVVQFDLSLSYIYIWKKLIFFCKICAP